MRSEGIDKILHRYTNPLCPNPKFMLRQSRRSLWNYPMLALSTYWMRSAERSLDVQFEHELDRLCRPELNFNIDEIQKKSEESYKAGVGVISMLVYRVLKTIGWRRILKTDFYRRLDKEVKSQRSRIEISQVRSKFVEFIGIYNKSIENIVEGQREVTFDTNFKMEDGETVKEKLDRFEVTAKRLIKNMRFK